MHLLSFSFVFQLWPCRHRGEATGREPSTNASDTQVRAPPTVSSITENFVCVSLKTAINTGKTTHKGLSMWLFVYFIYLFTFSWRFFSDDFLLSFLLLSFFFLFFQVFLLAFYGFIDSAAEQGDRKQGQREREGEWHAAKRLRPGVESGSAATPRHMGRPLYQLRTHFYFSKCCFRFPTVLHWGYHLIYVHA